ncbi:MAG TPA: aldo/keto reductase [Acidimicrobiales bacterium]|nr:aldo/keto reductase [Acidimicrobiales bacterium]
MEKRALGSLQVSVVGLGCNNFGMRCDEAQTKVVVDAAIEAGINFFDTADVYGGTQSEQFLGKALADHRDEVVIATKFASPIDQDPLHRGASTRWVNEAAEGSLRRLGVDCIDLYQQHRPDQDVAIEETLEALDGLVRAGKVREIGNSNFSAEQIAEADAVSKKNGWARFVTAQNQFNLLHRQPVKELLPACVEHGLAMLPFFPLASGLLTGKYRRGEATPSGSRLSAWGEEMAARILSDSNFDQVDFLERFAAAHDHTLLDLAFAWLAAQPAMGSIIAGATRPEQVGANVAAVDWTLSDAQVTEIAAGLDAIRAASRAQA